MFFQTPKFPSNKIKELLLRILDKILQKLKNSFLFSKKTTNSNTTNPLN